MYSEDSRKKVFYLHSDILALLIAYGILASIYSFSFFSSKFFALFFITLQVLIGVLSDEYSNVLNRGYLQEFKTSVQNGVKTVILLSLVLILGKCRFIADISSMSYYFLFNLFWVVAALTFLGRVIVKKGIPPKKENSKKILLVTDFSDEDRLEKVLLKNNYQILAYVSPERKYTELPVLWQVERFVTLWLIIRLMRFMLIKITILTSERLLGTSVFSVFQQLSRLAITQITMLLTA